MLNEILGTVFIAAGLFFTAVGVLGVYRFKDLLSRMHGSAILDTFGLIFVLIGTGFLAWELSSIVKLLVILLFMWIGGPVNTHLIAKLELQDTHKLEINGEEEEY